MKKDMHNIITNRDTLHRIAEFFKVLGEGGRLSILYCLANEELCVNDIAEKTNLSPSLVSHQLRVLRQSHLVKFERHGKLSIYKLDDEHVADMIETAYGHLKHRGEL